MGMPGPSGPANCLCDNAQRYSQCMEAIPDVCKLFSPIVSIFAKNVGEDTPDMCSECEQKVVLVCQQSRLALQAATTTVVRLDAV